MSWMQAEGNGPGAGGGAGDAALSGPGRAAPGAFRGRPVFDAEKCIGCAGCANNCPAREILIEDLCQEVRIIKYLGRRCTYCGRCAEVCPEKAITMSREFETATATSPTSADAGHLHGHLPALRACFKSRGPSRS